MEPPAVPKRKRERKHYVPRSRLPLQIVTRAESRNLPRKRARAPPPWWFCMWKDIMAEPPGTNYLALPPMRDLRPQLRGYELFNNHAPSLVPWTFPARRYSIPPPWRLSVHTYEGHTMVAAFRLVLPPLGPMARPAYRPGHEILARDTIVWFRVYEFDMSDELAPRYPFHLRHIIVTVDSPGEQPRLVCQVDGGKWK